MLSKKPVLIILSIITAMFLWVYVTGNVDPETKSKTNNIEISLVNTEELANQGLAVANEGEMAASVYITGKRSVVNQAKSNGIKATVDVGRAQKGENKLSMEFETPTGVSVDTSMGNSVTVMVEDRVSKTLPVEIVFTGSESDDGYKPWATEVWPEEITVYGASSLVKEAVAINAEIDALDAGTDAKNVKADVFAVDKSGNEVVGLVYDRDYVMATIQNLKQKEVAVNIKARNLDRRYKIGKTSGLDSVTVLGTKETLENLNSIDVYADLSDIESGGVINVYVEPDLPYGVYLPEKITTKVKITIKLAG